MKEGSWLGSSSGKEVKSQTELWCSLGSSNHLSAVLLLNDHLSTVSIIHDVIVSHSRTICSFIDKVLSRYEDILAFTGCSHNLTAEEDNELRQMHHEVSHWQEREIEGVEKRKLGCLERLISHPRQIFTWWLVRLVETEACSSLPIDVQISHSSLITAEELSPFINHQNILAGLDYVVSIRSDVFVYAYDGNMDKAVQGHRRFEGFKKTINPDRLAYKLPVIFMEFNGLNMQF